MLKLETDESSDDSLEITILPPEIMAHIFSFLPAKALYQVSLVCRNWADISNENALQHFIFLQSFLAHIRDSNSKMQANLIPDEWLLKKFSFKEFKRRFEECKANVGSEVTEIVSESKELTRQFQFDPFGGPLKTTLVISSGMGSVAWYKGLEGFDLLVFMLLPILLAVYNIFAFIKIRNTQVGQTTAQLAENRFTQFFQSFEPELDNKEKEKNLSEKKEKESDPAPDEGSATFLKKNN